MIRGILLLGVVLLAAPGQAAIAVRDDTGEIVNLPRPAQRVVSLAPHATELLFAAGAGERIVGNVRYSDYPPAASGIPRIGDNRSIDIERLLALKPDLLVVWRHNASQRQMEQLRGLGIPMYYSDPRTLKDIPDSVLKLGQLTATLPQAQRSAAELRKRIDDLAARYRTRPAVRVFYQVWDRPLYTLNERHIVTDMIRACGGENVFAHLHAAAPAVSVEAVLREDPEVIISGDRQDLGKDGLDIWRQYSRLGAVRRGNLFAIDADLMNRSGPRVVDGLEELCTRLEEARARRGEVQ